MTQKDMNLVRLVGTVVANLKGSFEILITEVNRKEEVFETVLPIMGNLPKGLKKGKRVEAICQILKGEDGIRHLTPLRIQETDAPDCNEAEMIGRAARPFEYYDGSRGNPFGNLLLRVGSQFVLGKAFGFFASKLDRTCTRDSRVKLFGRVQLREYTRKNGEQSAILEVIASPDETKVLWQAPVVDRMADIRELGTVETEEIPAGSMEPALAENPL